MTNTSWQPVGDWYNASVGSAGNYYHQHVVVPKSLALLDLKSGDSVLDLGCGQGILERRVPKEAYYQGIDTARNLIDIAKKQNQNQQHHFLVGDVTKPLQIQKKNFSHAACILALQNVEHPELLIANAAEYLQNNGKFLIVLNHPYFRIPRQSSWGIDETKKTQYRRVDRYLTPLKVPITAHPGQKSTVITWSFHYPLSAYSQWLKESHCVIDVIEEWTSDKTSVGKAAKMENRSRSEFPLFMAILARKIG